MAFLETVSKISWKISVGITGGFSKEIPADFLRSLKGNSRARIASEMS